jgi:hypothetical protein
MRAASRWVGWLYVACGLTTLGMFAVVGLTDLTVGDAMAGMGVLAAVTVAVILSKRIQLREATDPGHPLAVAYTILMMAGFVLVEDVAAPDAVWPVFVGLAPAVPCFIGAFRLLRR